MTHPKMVTHLTHDPLTHFHLCSATIAIIIFLNTLGINVPEGGLKKLEKMKRLGMSKIPCGHKRAYCHVEEQR